jgi:glycosyltransferase involved in cell wall biosynthesis
MQDLGVVQPIIQVMKHINLTKSKNNNKQFKSFFYFPVDCNLIKQLTKDLEFFDVLATYTEFGREEVCRFRPELRKKIKIINHGNNNAAYYPIHKEERDIFREEYFEDKAKDKFIISVINRNQPRKDIATSIFAFQELRSNWQFDKKPLLYLHMNPNDPMGIDLRALMMQTDMEEYKDYMFPPRHIENHDATEAQLRNIYNSSDLFLTTNLGEGWGLTITEAMACKLPIVAPLHTSITEISNNGERIYPITEFIPVCLKTDNMIRSMSFIDNVVEVMEQAVKDILVNSEVTNKKVNESQEYVKSKLDWKYITPKFITYIKDLL